MNEIYKQVIIDQKAELLTYKSVNYIEREELKKLDLNSSLAQIITGVRRCGKSTLAHLALRKKKYAYINFDEERFINLKPEDLNSLLELVYTVYEDFDCLFLDEVQNVEGWHLFVNRLLRQGVRIVLTGSNSRLLSTEMATHLTGRYNLIELLPFSFQEIIFFNKINITELTTKKKALLQNLFDTYCLQGGFPELLNKIPNRDYIENLFKAIINKDIFYRYNILHTKSFNDIAYFVMNNFSREVSFNRIKNIFQLGSEHTAKNYLGYLEEAYLTLTLSKFSFKPHESIRYRKTYSVDMAFNNISGVNFSQNLGYILENIVFLELYRRRQTMYFEIFYLKMNFEVDFVLFAGREAIELIQVCANDENTKTYKREVTALVKAADMLKCQKLTLISRHKKDTIKFENKLIQCIPVVEWLLNK